MNMVGWQATETTIYCDDVDDEVTILVYTDWSVKCTGYEKYGKGGDKTSLLKKRSKQVKRQLKCVGLECERVVQYKGKLLFQGAGKDF